MRVLVVDDDIIIRHYFVRTLRRHVEVEEASCVAEALAKFRAASFDVVIADERMPDGSGRALLARVSRLQSRCRRILISGHEVEADPDDSYERFFGKLGGLPNVVTWVRSVAALR
jgi:DNA-binding NtrC family response regulator